MSFTVDLASVLTPEVMAPLLADPEVQQRLIPYLPSGESLPQSSEELHNTISSPQFQQVTLNSLPELHTHFYTKKNPKKNKPEASVKVEVHEKNEPPLFSCRGGFTFINSFIYYSLIILRVSGN